jgi:putative phosphoesterase
MKSMLIGIFADAHDHVDNVRQAVAQFNRAGCDLVVFAGDFVSPIVIPPLRKLRCPVLACFGDNEGNRVGIAGGMRIIGKVGYPPFGFRTSDGIRILVTHSLDMLRGLTEGCDVVISAHSHRSGISRDKNGCLFINPGETSGWTYRKPSISLLKTDPLEARLIPLPEMPLVPVDE